MTGSAAMTGLVVMAVSDVMTAFAGTVAIAAGMTTAVVACEMAAMVATTAEAGAAMAVAAIGS
ncbi:hypothetical protein OX90_24145 [Pseudomonas coronafaciens pv. porri]|uniref:Uncharacterized protein n=1 Tax=Pseudomonas coronafaciens pv. porri TaxID=83964 RepID=A0ABR5JHV4_9PSED|nr:hypothetical protein OX90_24145 [Pseudomonas coronafaciens pv. porri]KOP54642.1 hypothetical protein OX88_17075 [Pseudomonas coronafaciens pv. porri]